MKTIGSARVSQVLIHKWVKAFRRSGGTEGMLQHAIEDAALMQRMIDPVKDPTFEKAQEVLMAAVARGMKKVDEREYEFEDPGLSLNVMKALPIVRERKIIEPQIWYEPYEWAKKEVAPHKERMVISEFKSGWGAPLYLHKGDGIAADAREIVAFALVMRLAIDVRIMWLRSVHPLNTPRDYIVSDGGTHSIHMTHDGHL